MRSIMESPACTDIFMPTPPRSILIAVEGIDGAGKTTQVNLLRAALDAVGEIPVVSKEPTGGQWGTIIRESASTGRLAPDRELELFIRDRTEHVQTLIQPALDAGRVVILDRYFYSTIAYQGARGIDPASVRGLMTERFPVPDAVFLLDIDPWVSVDRIAYSRGETPNHFEGREDLAVSRRIFNSIEGDEIFRINGEDTAEAVHRQIIEAFTRGPLKAKRCAKDYGCDDPFHCIPRLTNTCEWARLSQALHKHLDAPTTAKG
jgi:dTMP kinase